MAQSINIKIAGHPYNISATSAQHEEVIRKAADMLNKKISQYQEKFPNKGMTEILSFMALNVCMSNIMLQKQVGSLKEEEDALASELKRYLDDIEKTSR